MKSFVRVFSLLLCAAMLLCTFPHAKAERLKGGRIPQLESIEYDEMISGYTFTDFSDLKEIVKVAKNNPDNYYEYAYAFMGEFTFTQSIEIPANLAITIMDDVVIPSDVTVTVNGFLSTYCLDVQGYMNIAENGCLYPRSSVSIAGTFDLRGMLSIGQYQAIYGAERINYLDNGHAVVKCYFVNSDQIKEVATEALATELPWRYNLVPDERIIQLDDPVVLPENVSLDLCYKNLLVTGESITINGNLNVDANTPIEIQNDLILDGTSTLYAYSEDGDAKIVFGGNVTNNSYMGIIGQVVFKNTVTNLSVMDIWYDYGGSLKFEKPESYIDKAGEKMGEIYVYSEADSFPNEAIAGLNVNSFTKIDVSSDWDMPYWCLSGYHDHTIVEDSAVAPTCLTAGLTAGSHCAGCGEVFVKQETMAPLGHDYGLGEDGNPDFWDTTCDVCGAERVVDKHRPTHSMYRMYNPNTGEHFYTGSMEERKMLEAAGWKYEGVGFTFPATTGKPVYRLYDKFGTMEHLYTMDEAEKDKLLAEGWILEGIAFNSGREDEVPQYRLYNPNVTVGAYHFTASLEERDALLAEGWQDQGIGFYTCWQ